MKSSIINTAILKSLREINFKKYLKLISIIYLSVFLLFFFGGIKKIIPVHAKPPAVSHGIILDSIAMAFFASFLLMMIGSWVAIVLNFFILLNSKNNNANFGNAKPLEFYILTAEYLNEKGLVARTRLLIFFILFFISLLLAMLIPFLIDGIFNLI